MSGTGHYEIRRHMVDGVLGIFWCEGASSMLAMSFGAQQLPLIADAIAKYQADHSADNQNRKENVSR